MLPHASGKHANTMHAGTRTRTRTHAHTRVPGLGAGSSPTTEHSEGTFCAPGAVGRDSTRSISFNSRGGCFRRTVLSALGNRGIARLRNLANVPQLTRGRARTRAGSEAPSPGSTPGPNVGRHDPACTRRASRVGKSSGNTCRYVGILLRRTDDQTQHTRPPSICKVV